MSDTSADRPAEEDAPARGAYDLPIVGPTSKEELAFYAGTGLAAAFRLVSWQTALLIAAGHAVMHRARNRTVRELVAGVEETL